LGIAVFFFLQKKKNPGNGISNSLKKQKYLGQKKRKKKNKK